MLAMVATRGRREGRSEMTSVFTMLIQDAASEVVEHVRVKTTEDVLNNLNAYDWAGERAKENSLGDEYCPPQLVVNNETTEDNLHITPEHEGQYELWFHTSGPPRKLLGFIPLFAESILFTSQASSRNTMEDAVRHFMKNNKPWFDKNFKKD